MPVMLFGGGSVDRGQPVWYTAAARARRWSGPRTIRRVGFVGGGDRDIEREVRVNERIRAREVRLIDENGAQLGVMPARDALQVARERNLDLIEVAPKAQPPVCRIMDYGKHKYQQAKRDRQARKKHKGAEVRVLVLRNPQIAQHDLEIKLRKLRELLLEGNKVRINLRLRGRQMSRPELGHTLMKRITLELADAAQMEGMPRREGRVMSMLVAPKPGMRPAPPKKAEATVDAKEQVSEKQAEEPRAVEEQPQRVEDQPRPGEERPPQAEDAEDSGEAG